MSDTMMVNLKEFFEKVEFEKHHQMTKKGAKIPTRPIVTLFQF